MSISIRVIALFLSLIVTGCALGPSSPEDAPPIAAAGAPPSIAATETLLFNGTLYQLGFSERDQEVPVYEFFLPNESPAQWTELTGFRIYPPRADDDTPMGHARAAAALFRNHYPDIELALYRHLGGEAAMLELIVPAAPGRDHREFNVFKFYRDSDSERVVSFHYSKKLVGANAGAAAASSVRRLRHQVLPAMAAFPHYRYEN